MKRAILIFGLAVSIGQTERLSAQEDPWAGTPQKAFFESKIIEIYQCTTCHTVAGSGGTVGPILDRVGIRREEEWLRRWLKDPGSIKTGTKMPKFDFTPEEFDQVVEHLTNMKLPLRTNEILSKPISETEQGALLFEDYDCLACHRIGSEGRFVGPNLTWVGSRKEPAWETVWLHDPNAWKPGTFMPNFNLPKAANQALTAFLHTLQGQRNSEAQLWEFQTNFFLGNKDHRRGQLIYERFGCWSCHQMDGSGGEKNPNAAPDGLTPNIRTTTNDFSLAAVKTRLSKRQVPKAINPTSMAAPFTCPAYATEMNDDEFSDLYAFLKTFAPQKPKFRFR